MNKPEFQERWYGDKRFLHKKTDDLFGMSGKRTSRKKVSEGM